MIKSAIDKIASMAAPSIFNVDGRDYASENLVLLKKPKYTPKPIELSGLDSVCKMVRHEVEKVGRKIFVQIKDYNVVKVFTTYDDEYERAYLYNCVAETPNVTVNNFNSYEKEVIELRSLFIPNDDCNYLLTLLGSITTESKVVSTDNGVSTSVEAKQGIALSQMIAVKPRVTMKPFRTFLEVEQPESEFLLRISGDGKVGLWEADGGVWKLEATRNVASFFEKELKDLVEKGNVVVIR